MSKVSLTMTVTVTYFYSGQRSNMELLCSLHCKPPIIETIRLYAHKTFYERSTREWGTHFHQFYWLSTVKVKMVETTTESAPQPHDGNGGYHCRVGPQHNGGNSGNNFSVGTPHILQLV